MSKPDKKQRREAKRKAKRQETRRRESVSPAKRLAEAKGEIECWISEDFESMGQLQIMVFKRGGGLSGVACFLVDRGVVGLKDAWLRMAIDHAEFEEMLDASEDRGVDMRRSDAEEVRRWIAGGLRWAHDHGMRLPIDWMRPASLIGGVGDWASADVSGFTKEFAGHPEDLRQRLVGQSLDSFLERGDITFVFSEDAPYMNQRTGHYVHAPGSEFDDEEIDEEDLEAIVNSLPEEEMNALARRLEPPATALANETVDWLAARNETPSPELSEAWRSMMLATMLARAAMPEAEDEQVADLSYELLRSMAGRIESGRLAELQRAVGQMIDHLETNSHMMREAVLKHGLAGELIDEAADEST